MRAATEQMASFARVASTGWLEGPAGSAARAAAHFAWTAHRLPTLFRTPMVAHALSPRLPAPPALHRLVAQLSGRLAVVNPIGAARLPTNLVIATRALVREALTGGIPRAPVPADAATALPPLAPGLGAGAHAPLPVAAARAAHERRLATALLDALPPETRERLRAPADWAAVALYEATAPRVRVEPAEERGGQARALVELRYRMAIAVGAGTPPADWRAIDAAVAAAAAGPWPPTPGAVADAPLWFVGRLLVPDPWLATHADAETLARWAQVTGRAGTRDGYWFPESWERFLEAGRHVGCVTPADVWRGRRGRLAGASAAPADEDALPWAAPVARSAFAHSPLGPEVERGVCVPPGYALVECVGTLGVAVVTL